MGINNHWRNKQLQQNLLWQEIECLKFCQRQNIKWAYYGFKGHFYDVCLQTLNFDKSLYNGIIIINTPGQVTIKAFINQIQNWLLPQVKTAYLAINRFEFIIDNYNDNIDYPENINECIDLLAYNCSSKFQRLYTVPKIDGHNFVGVHGLDVFVYENC